MFIKAYKLNLLLATNTLMVLMVVMMELSTCSQSNTTLSDFENSEELIQLKRGLKAVDYIMVSE